jgi:hypothetical protein
MSFMFGRHLFSTKPHTQTHELIDEFSTPILNCALFPNCPPRLYVPIRAFSAVEIGRVNRHMRSWMELYGARKRNLIRIEHCQRLLPVHMAHNKQQPHRCILLIILARLSSPQRYRERLKCLLARNAGGERACSVHEQYGETCPGDWS